MFFFQSGNKVLIKLKLLKRTLTFFALLIPIDVFAQGESSASSLGAGEMFRAFILVLVGLCWIYVLWNWVDLQLIIKRKRGKKFELVSELPDEVLNRAENLIKNSSKEKRPPTEEELKMFRR